MADTLDTVEGTGGTYKELAAEARRKADREAYGSKWPHNAIRLEIRAASYEICNVLWEIAERSYNLYATGRP